jgi:hypothetical protein
LQPFTFERREAANNFFWDGYCMATPGVKREHRTTSISMTSTLGSSCVTSTNYRVLDRKGVHDYRNRPYISEVKHIECWVYRIFSPTFIVGV